MPSEYTKVELLSEEVFRRKTAGETNREIAESYGLSKKQIKELGHTSELQSPLDCQRLYSAPQRQTTEKHSR